MSQFYSIRREESESIRDLSDRFMKVYDAIPSEFKPPTGIDQLQYAEAFDSEFSLWLGKRRSSSLVDMLKNPIEGEMNLTTTRDKGREEDERTQNEDLP